ncbi:long-chain-fatty-acid- CoA ligase IcfB (plasmid) [Phaeobacter inhibens]|uniref:Long-chain-fatty-acid-CoA ligase IcfB n=1 Tax=Phaeobacter inhibens TaxID=221822 RepID=A0ABM6RKJ8_9RHOB|nr:AMP-binding protein [Phaeobacter inhibens]AUQ52476.1 long-chain-fatty-acid- CoA ligase IcfB [Phaeobacter inhibens]AUQ97081.1 long-chain-fatty-acid- CoA ligase IcfB [Phaeobacter inhibens]AUR22281.1 long-chain-fatty-acid- CoA ligase IcfB [Phaeobacter inhibens]
MSEIFLPQRLTVKHREDGALHLSSPYSLRPYAKRTGDWLEHWATHTPNAVFVAERAGEGWNEVTYAAALEKVRALASSLLDLGLTQKAPLMLLSGKSVEHALLALAAQYVGIPSVAIAEQYSLVPAAHNKLRHVVDLIEPGGIFVQASKKFEAAIDSGILGARPVISGDGGMKLSFSDLLPGGAGDVDVAKAKVGTDTVAKFLFTSGSTSMPKAVITTHGMLTANQMQRTMAWPFLADAPPRMVDWLPWNHGAGGSANFNMMLANGGALFLDDGGPSEKGITRSIENITMAGQTVCATVPIGLSMMAQAMRTNKVFRKAFFQDLSLVYYAAASMPQAVWDELKNHAMEETGCVPEMSAGWGLTETAPSAFMVQKTMNRAGMIGVPLPGMNAKLIPTTNGAYEIRVKGPNITPGYFNAPDKTAEAFDDEGYLITGDAVRFVDENNPDEGLAFEGRLSEDFKMSTGTFVQATKVRATAVSAMNNVVADLVICGHGRDELGALAFIKPDFLALLENGSQTDGDGALNHPKLLDAMSEAMMRLAAGGAGSSMRIARMLALEEPASLSEGETTDKGNLNQKLLLKTRAKWVERLFNDADQSVAHLNR